MADKQITELPANSGVTNETLFPAYQPGAVAPAQKVTGAQVRSFAEDAAKKAAGSIARGGTFTPQFNDATGYLSWTNDAGLPNPDPVQLEGVSSVNGKTGAVKLSAADVGAVAKDGSVSMTSNLSVLNTSMNQVAVRFRPADGGQHAVNGGYSAITISTNDVVGDYNKGRTLMLRNAKAAANIANSLVLRDTVDGANADYPIYHTGNKPSGSYTGNGSATQRTIATGGIGSAVMIWGNGFNAIVGVNGAVYWSNAGTTNGVASTEMKFADGVLMLATTNSFNKSGLTYTYQVL